MTEEKEIVQETQALDPTQKWWVNSDGAYMLSTVGGEDGVDSTWIEVPFGPEYWDQVWNFDTQTYGPSTFKATQAEDAWRDAELLFIGEQLLMIEDDDPNALPGTSAQWRAYRVQVRAWKTGHVDFPFGTRPSRP